VRTVAFYKPTWGLMHVSEGLLGFFDTEPTKLSRLNRQ
jgi:hypothetical protein